MFMERNYQLSDIKLDEPNQSDSRQDVPRVKDEDLYDEDKVCTIFFI